MAILCKQCGRQYDVTLFQFGRSVVCECGARLTRRMEIIVGKQHRSVGAEAAGVGFLVPAEANSLFVYVIRHGKTVWNESGRLQGQADVELSDEGRAEARLLAAALAAVPFDAAYTSDLRRAAETAEIILEGRDVPLTRTAALREEDYGEWSGKTYEEIVEGWPEECKARERDRVNSRPPGGESLGELEERVAAQMDEIARAHPRGRVLVVTHGGPAFVFLSKVMAPDGKLKGDFSVGNCAINVAAFTGSGWKLERLNDTCHLRDGV